jgi:carbon-monoxide dehydrogenase large subunit
MVTEPDPKFRGRREDERLITGRGRYVADLNVTGQLYAAFKRSDRPHAIIRKISAHDARQAPGVVAVVVASDIAGTGLVGRPPHLPFPGRGGSKLIAPGQPLLATERVRYVGECVVMVVAESRDAALDAVESVDVEYEDLPPVIGVHAALAGATIIHPELPGNICFDFEYGDEQETARLLASATHRVQLSMESPRVAPTPMELRGALARYDRAVGRYEIACANQGTSVVRESLASMMGEPADKIRVDPVDVGGAFGARGAAFAEYPLMLHMAKQLGRPIKWVSTRTEDFMTDTHGRAVTLEGELGFDSKGRFLALRTNWICDTGAYVSASGALTNSVNGRTIGAGVYQVKALYGRHRQVMTNTSSTGAYRGAGRPDAVYLVERLVDEAATVLGMDRLSVRERNVIRANQIPYKNRTGVTIDSGDFGQLIRSVRELGNWDSFRKRRAKAVRRGALRGIGCAVFLEPSGGGRYPKDEIAITFTRDCRIELFAVAGSSGQGHETVFPELVARTLGIDTQLVSLRAGDPDGPSLVGNAAFGSRTAFAQGSACLLGARQAIEKGAQFAADMLEVSSTDVEFRDGRYKIKGTDRGVTFIQVMHCCATFDPNPLDLVAETPIAFAFPSGAHVAEIEIDRATGAVQVVGYAAVDDVGTVLNSTLAAGQLHGGIMQGAGQVFGEHCVYDRDTGQLLTASFMDYFIPRADLLSDIKTVDCPTSSPTNLLGAKGAGEAGTTGALAACMSAVMDALRSAGVTQFDMPATPARLWEAINGVKSMS